MLAHDDESESGDEIIAIDRIQTILDSSPRTKAWYEWSNGKHIVKLIGGVVAAAPMAMYNLIKEIEKGNLSAGIGSAIVSFGCNMAIFYSFELIKSPFFAFAILSESCKRPTLAVVVVAGLTASGALTAQLVHGQPVKWAVPISLAFVNYAATRLVGLVDNNRSWRGNLAMGGVGLVLFSPLVSIWMGDTASLFSMPSIPKMVSDHLTVGSYVGGSFAAAFGAIGSIITVLFYCQAISSIPGRIEALYEGLSNFFEQYMGFGPTSSKMLSGFLTVITIGALSYGGYYSMAGFGVAVSAALQCTPAGELCWLSNLLDISSAWIDFLAIFEQAASGLVNASALISATTNAGPLIIKALTKVLEACTVGHGNAADNPSNVVVEGANSGESYAINGDALAFGPRSYGTVSPSGNYDSLTDAYVSTDDRGPLVC